MAANSRIELQFEVIQRDWINGGEFLGQVGAGRCPLTGSNEGETHDRFLEAGAIAPICGIPSFVTMKGGDYFFVPSIKALKGIAVGDICKDEPLPFGRLSSSVSETPALQSEARLRDFGVRIITCKKKSIRVRLPREHSDADLASVADTLFVFVGQHRDAVEVLSSRPAGEGAPPKFSVAHYLQASREITRGEELLLAMDPGGPLDVKRRRRLRIMRKAYEDQKWSDFSNNIVRKFIRETVDQIERRVSQSGHIDILQDLAFLLPYRILERFVGLPGPDHLSEMVVALQYDKRYITKLPPDWLRQRPEQPVADPAYLTAHMWSRLCFAEVIANILDKRELTGAAIQAASEMLTHIDEKIMEERLKHGTGEPDTLLKQLVRQAPDFVQPGFDENAYFAEVRAILTDLMTTISINIGLPFSKAISGRPGSWLRPVQIRNSAGRDSRPPSGRGRDAVA